MNGDLGTRILTGILFGAVLIIYLGPNPDADGGRWHGSWPVKILTGIVYVGALALIIKSSIGMPMPHVLAGLLPAVGAAGLGLTLGRRRRARRLAAQRDAARLSESRRPELTE